ncbi:MAG: glutathione peroxidase [Prolixibacteraceae bacterium]|nr:glutathione peroxidase [Prolixibacteraceae bacterium]MBN2649034.1 glutathione peroxidase [Prolixibacteraceae bacterium]
MKQVLFIAMFVISISAYTQNEKKLFDFSFNDISGQEFEVNSLEGKKVLIVNTASKCGLTPQFEDLEKLYQQYKDQNFIIIGFPANNFMNQEPGTNEEIAEFCQLNYGVTFPMMEKISVKGDDMHPLYQWLTKSTLSDVQWNFQKYMINPDGSIAGWSKPRTKPFDKDITDWIEGE